MKWTLSINVTHKNKGSFDFFCECIKQTNQIIEEKSIGSTINHSTNSNWLDIGLLEISSNSYDWLISTLYIFYALTGQTKKMIESDNHLYAFIEKHNLKKMHEFKFNKEDEFGLINLNYINSIDWKTIKSETIDK